jgi:hypothetical protein
MALRPCSHPAAVDDGLPPFCLPQRQPARDPRPHALTRSRRISSAMIDLNRSVLLMTQRRLLQTRRSIRAAIRSVIGFTDA